MRSLAVLLLLAALVPAGEFEDAAALEARATKETDPRMAQGYRMLAALAKQRSRALADGNKRIAAQALSRMGVGYFQLNEPRRALHALEVVAEEFKALGDRSNFIIALGSAGAAAGRCGDLERGAALQKRAIGLLEQDGARDGRLATALVNLGGTLVALGKIEEGHGHLERAVAIFEETGNPARVAAALNQRGEAERQLGRYDDALATLGRAAQLAGKAGDRRAEAYSGAATGRLLMQLGDFEQALVVLQRSRDLHERLRNAHGYALALDYLGTAHSFLGDLRTAIACKERARTLLERMGDRASFAGASSSLAMTYLEVGDPERSRAILEKLVPQAKKIEDPLMLANVWNGLAAAYFALDDLERALPFARRALDAARKLGSEEGIGATLHNLAAYYAAAGDPRAEACEREAIVHYEKSNPLRAASSRRWLAAYLMRHENAPNKAAPLAEQALAELREHGATPRPLAYAHGTLAAIVLAQGDAKRASRLAQRGIEIGSAMRAGVSSELAAKTHEGWTDLHEIGVRAGIAARDPGAAFHALESGRASGLVEALGGRAALRRATVPAGLRAEEAAALRTEAAASELYRRARAAGKREAIRQRREELDAARTRRLAVTERIEREARDAAQLTYGRVAKLADVQARLRPHEAMVLYARTDKYATRMIHALVLTADALRAVEIGEAAAVEKDAGMLRLGLADLKTRGARRTKTDDAPGAAEAAARLRRRLIAPLGLDGKTTRLLVSPSGPLAYVPYALLDEREIAYAPSATVYDLLASRATKAGEGVLALGDPAYEGALAPLPGSRVEAKAVGTDVLLGKEASETGFLAAVGKRPRWRALHFACHGLIDTDRPQLSSLALVGDGSNDGALTVLDIFRAKLPADLAVLSACETGRGKLYRAEGVFGLTRAFLFAGPPRVIVSLWKVEDEATRALMTKFYELWDKHPAATALRDAQRFVAAQEKWADPYFWAAWQLWGLPE